MKYFFFNLLLFYKWDIILNIANNIKPICILLKQLKYFLFLKEENPWLSTGFPWLWNMNFPPCHLAYSIFHLQLTRSYLFDLGDINKLLHGKYWQLQSGPRRWLKRTKKGCKNGQKGVTGWGKGPCQMHWTENDSSDRSY